MRAMSEVYRLMDKKAYKVTWRDQTQEFYTIHEAMGFIEAQMRGDQLLDLIVLERQ